MAADAAMYELRITNYELRITNWMLARLRAEMRSECGGGGENVTGGWLGRLFFELRITNFESHHHDDR